MHGTTIEGLSGVWLSDDLSHGIFARVNGLVLGDFEVSNQTLESESM